MPGEIEAMGDVVTGGLLARAVEPHAGEARSDGAAGTCLNCGADVSGAFCGTCGQKLHLHRTLAEFWHDLAHSVFHFDGKIWRTLPLLAWNPGHLTRRYIHGERAKFVSPFALFLFSVFLMFAIFSWVLPQGKTTPKVPTPKEAVAELDNDRQDLRKQIDELVAIRRNAEARRAQTDWIDGEIGRTRALLAKIEADKNIDISAEAIGKRRLEVNRRELESGIAELEAKKAEAIKAGQPTAETQKEIDTLKTGLAVMTAAASRYGDGAFEIDNVNLNFGWPAIQEAIKHAAENPQLLIYKLQSNAYKFSWALIPISVPFLWLLFFWRRDYFIFDHAVFVTYSIAFMMMLTTLSAVAIQFSATEIIGGFLLTLYPPFHMYRQLKQAYGLTRFGALWRTVLLLSFAMTALTLFFGLILSMGLTG